MMRTLRSLRRAPWFAATVVGVIALSMAVTVTVFAVVDAALFRPLPYQEPDRLFSVAAGHAKLPEAIGVRAVSRADLAAWNRALPEARVAAYYRGDVATVGANDTVRSARVDPNFFEVLGASPAVGGFASADFELRAPILPAVISHGFWMRRFGGDLAAVGRTLSNAEGQGIRVVGILPPGFLMPDSLGPEVLTPLVRSPHPETDRGRSFYVLARLPASMRPQDAASRLTGAAVGLAVTWPPVAASPDQSERVRIGRGPFDQVALVPIREALTSGYRVTAWIVFWAAGALVLLACVSVTGLSVARAQDRWRDLAVRRALGARQLDLVRLLAAEQAAIVFAGAAVGVIAARPMLVITLSLMPRYLLVKDAAIDWRVLVGTALAAAACVAGITLFSVRTAWRSALRSTMSEGGAVTIRRRAWVVATQLALGLAITVGGALSLDSLFRVWTEEPGIQVVNTAIVRYGTPAGLSAGAVEDLLNGLRALPDVAHAGGVLGPFLENAMRGSQFDTPAGVQDPGTESLAVTDGFFDAAGVRAVQGRLPTGAELTSGATVAVVTAVVAAEYWPGRQAVGQFLTMDGRSFTVIGVVPDARAVALDVDPDGTIYWPVAASPRPGVNSVMVEFRHDGRASLPAAVDYLTRACPTCVFRRAEMVSDALGATIRPRQFRAWIFTSFAVAALAIVGAGILGLMAMTTARRTREIGIRMALGATASGVVGLLLREQIAVSAMGLAGGAIAAAWAVRFMSSLLYKIEVYDWVAWTVAVACLVGISALAGAVPAFRASRADPVRALRIE